MFSWLTASLTAVSLLVSVYLSLSVCGPELGVAALPPPCPFGSYLLRFFLRLLIASLVFCLPCVVCFTCLLGSSFLSVLIVPFVPLGWCLVFLAVDWSRISSISLVPINFCGPYSFHPNQILVSLRPQQRLQRGTSGRRLVRGITLLDPQANPFQHCLWP